MLVTLRHQNIVQFYGLVVDKAQIPKWLVMECASGTLQGFLLGAIDGIHLQELVDICVDILEGLAFLHGIAPAAVVHR